MIRFSGITPQSELQPQGKSHVISLDDMMADIATINPSLQTKPAIDPNLHTKPNEQTPEEIAEGFMIAVLKMEFTQSLIFPEDDPLAEEETGW